MSYPDPRYLGAGGEISATVRLATEPPELDQRTTRASYLATGAGNRRPVRPLPLGFQGSAQRPRPAFPQVHLGVVLRAFRRGPALRRPGWSKGRPGDFLYVPEGGVHGFRNDSGEPASMLILFAPGAPREDYFERVATTAQMSEEERTEFYLRHDTFWV